MSEEMQRKKRILSGIQPTGTFTLGTAAACVVLAIMIYLLFRPAPKYNGEIQIKDAADVTE